MLHPHYRTITARDKTPTTFDRIGIVPPRRRRAATNLEAQSLLSR